MHDGDEPEYETFNASESEVFLGLQTVDVLKNFNYNSGDPLVEIGAIQSSIHTSPWKTHNAFRKIPMEQMYALRDGQMVGCLNNVDVFKQRIHLE